jgi:hypothetical protein
LTKYVSGLRPSSTQLSKPRVARAWAASARAAPKRTLHHNSGRALARDGASGHADGALARRGAHVCQPLRSRVAAPCVASTRTPVSRFVPQRTGRGLDTHAHALRREWRGHIRDGLHRALQLVHLRCPSTARLSRQHTTPHNEAALEPRDAPPTAPFR